MTIPSLPPPSRAPRQPWAILLAALALVLLSAAQLVYRSTLPTDGWAVITTESFDSSDWQYIANLVGAPSGLQRDDIVVAVDGRSVQGMAGTAAVAPPPGWGTRPAAVLGLVRHQQPLTLTVPIVRWTLPALWRRLLVMPEYLVGIVGGLLTTALALVTIRRRPELPAAQMLLLLSASFLANTISYLAPDGLSTQFNRLALISSGLFGALLFPLLLAPSLLAFTLVFPQPKRIVARYPALAWAPFGLGLLVCAALVSGQGAVLGWITTQAMVGAALLSLGHAALTQRDVVSRMQLVWAGSGLALGMSLMLIVFPAAAGLIADPLLAQVLGAGFQVGFTIIGVFLAIAVLRYRLFDIDLVVNRALVYGTLTAGVVGLYIAIVGYLSTVLRVRDDLVLSLIATGIVAVVFAPVRGLVQRGVNRLMYGQRDEPYQVVARLGRQLAGALEPASALALTVETVARALKLPYVAIALEQSGHRHVVAAYGAARADVSRVPLLYAGEPIGELIVAPRAPNERFGGADRRLLSDLARQIAVAAHAVLLSDTLEQARMRLVTERGEARRRLGSDLHDGVGHQLAGISHYVERASRALESDPGLARRLLADSGRQLMALSAQVRALAHQLFPPELELLGLAGALRERAQTYDGLRVSVDAPEQLPPLPAEVEAAVYMIAMEALTNVHKHAMARECRLRLRLATSTGAGAGAALELEVADDGRGMPEVPSGGLGLLSMQARAAEVGGSCSVAAQPGGGTVVRVRVPCPASGE